MRLIFALSGKTQLQNNGKMVMEKEKEEEFRCLSFIPSVSIYWAFTTKYSSGCLEYIEQPNRQRSCPHGIYHSCYIAPPQQPPHNLLCSHVNFVIPEVNCCHPARSANPFVVGHWDYREQLWQRVLGKMREVVHFLDISQATLGWTETFRMQIWPFCREDKEMIAKSIDKPKCSPIWWKTQGQDSGQASVVLYTPVLAGKCHNQLAVSVVKSGLGSQTCS